MTERLNALALCVLLLAGCAGEGYLLKRKTDDPPADTETGVDTETVPRDTDDGASGWTDPRTFLVESDGTRSLGDPDLPFNDTRDQGSKLVYFDPVAGDNATAEVYWWDGEQLVDGKGRAENPDNGEMYGRDPLLPNEGAIRPFTHFVSEGDDRLRTQASSEGPNGWRFSGVAGGYPDWFLFRRGAVHDTFDRMLVGGQSEDAPTVIAAFGPEADGRAIIDPAAFNPFSGHNWGITPNWLHLALFGLEIRAPFGFLGADTAASFAGGPVTAFVEDCYWPEGGIVYPPTKSVIRRSVVAGCFAQDSTVNGYYATGDQNEVLVEESLFYRNGFQSDPFATPDPVRAVTGRNLYVGGGAESGHTFRSVISADGGSGGPQLRFGGRVLESLVIEGYWYGTIEDPAALTAWGTDQRGSALEVRDSVQLLYGYPTPADPDPEGTSDPRAHPGWGLSIQGATYGAEVTGNIVTGAMLEDELGGTAAAFGVELAFTSDAVTQRNNRVADNIFYRTGAGLALDGDGAGVLGIGITGNVFVAQTAMTDTATNLTADQHSTIDGNRFYTAASLGTGPWLGENETGAIEDAAAAEGWPDPDRTLRRYVEEVLNLTLLDWSDDPFLAPAEADRRAAASEPYDPTGMKTFMAVASRMRKGGADSVPPSGKPSYTGDYRFDPRLTARAVVNWIRKGFDLPAAGE